MKTVVQLIFGWALLLTMVGCQGEPFGEAPPDLDEETASFNMEPFPDDVEFTMTTQVLDVSSGAYSPGDVQRNTSPEAILAAFDKLEWGDERLVPKVKIICNANGRAHSYFGISKNRTRADLPIEATWQFLRPDAKFLRVCHDIESVQQARKLLQLYLSNDPQLLTTVYWNEY